MVVKNVAPHVRAENERRRREEQEAFRKQSEDVRKTLLDMGRQDLVDELDALRRFGGKIHLSPEQSTYYDSDKYKRDQEYLSAPHPSEHVTLRDFWFWFSHAYHDPALPPLGFWRLFGIFGWVVMIIWGIHRLCS